MNPAHLASQYIAADPSEPLKLLCRAEIISYRSSPLRSYPFLRPRLTDSINSKSLCFLSSGVTWRSSPEDSSMRDCRGASQTLRANSSPFRACRASPSATSARKGNRSAGKSGAGSSKLSKAFWSIVTRLSGVCDDSVKTLEGQPIAGTADDAELTGNDSEEPH